MLDHDLNGATLLLEDDVDNTLEVDAAVDDAVAALEFGGDDFLRHLGCYKIACKLLVRAGTG